MKRELIRRRRSAWRSEEGLIIRLRKETNRIEGKKKWKMIDKLLRKLIKDKEGSRKGGIILVIIYLNNFLSFLSCEKK